MTKHTVLVTFALTTLLGSLALPVAAVTYRWVDSNGHVHYSDTMPPQQAGMGHQELDKQGRVVKDVERTRRTAEEQRRAEEVRRRAEAERQKQLDQERRDRALLTSYTSEEEIDLVRDRALELEKLQLESLQSQMNNASEKLTYANGELKKSPGARSFMQMRDEAQNDLARIGEMLRQRQDNQDQIRAKYEADKLRFRELKARTPR
jgi:hypothetical protein